MGTDCPMGYRVEVEMAVAMALMMMERPLPARLRPEDIGVPHGTGSTDHTHLAQSALSMTSGRAT